MFTSSCSTQPSTLRATLATRVSSYDTWATVRTSRCMGAIVATANVTPMRAASSAESMTRCAVSAEAVAA